jgi:dUTP pyrophosphatase
MKIKVKKLHPDAVLPAKTYDSDFCYDVVATSREEIAKNVYRYGIGLAFQAERSEGELDGSTRICIEGRARSSVWKKGMVLSNGVGTIDENYTGEVSFVFYHVMPDLPPYKVGDKICQIYVHTTDTTQFVEVESLYATDRGTGREGSTGE